MDYQNLSNQELVKIVVSGCKFKYFSYNHKDALAEYKQMNKQDADAMSFISNPDCYDMPEDLKLKHRIEKVGKIRQIHFSPNGNAFRFKIGAKYAKTFYPKDFGINVFPVQE
ncbi:MAG: hypothetical protein IMY67_01785 [Bacteroidetes bacterium]|nr:hypothetical protein [Bacteroidota bacterium]